MGDVTRHESAARRFAARVRQLKEGSGHSYGTLAQRLHMSTSTLHRYCSGAAVPVDYAPVERLARLCGATPEELMELHRLWVRADAARARRESVREPEAVGETERERPGPGPGPEGAQHEHRRPGPATHGGPSRGSALGPLAVGMVAALVLVVTTMNVALPERPQGPPSQDTPARTAPVGSEDIVPLTASVRSHVWLAGCGHRYLVDRLPARVPAPPSPQDAAQWATGLGAVHGGSTIVEATVRGEGPGAVVVEALYVRITEREQPLDWPAFEMSMGCGGALTPAAFTVGLDAERPLARPRDGFDGESGDAGSALPAPELPYQVTENDPLALRVEATAEDCDCRWLLELEWSSGAERGTLRIDDNGEPFRTSGIPNEAVHVYPHGSGGWERM